MVVDLDLDMILYANTYPKHLDRISQITAALLRGEAGLSIVILRMQIRNLRRFDDLTFRLATSKYPPTNTVTALS